MLYAEQRQQNLDLWNSRPPNATRTRAGIQLWCTETALPVSAPSAWTTTPSLSWMPKAIHNWRAVMKLWLEKWVNTRSIVNCTWHPTQTWCCRSKSRMCPSRCQQHAVAQQTTATRNTSMCWNKNQLATEKPPHKYSVASLRPSVHNNTLIQWHVCLHMHHPSSPHFSCTYACPNSHVASDKWVLTRCNTKLDTGFKPQDQKERVEQWHGVCYSGWRQCGGFVGIWRYINISARP